MKHLSSLILVSLLLLPCMFSCCNCKTNKGPKLEQVTIISRHGVRVPLAKYNKDLDSVLSVNYHWPQWPVEGGHLSLRGSVLEYMAGEYFREYFKENGLRLTPNNAYFSASPKQRTVETSHAFAAGLFPRQKVDVKYLGPQDFSTTYYDPEFLPLLNGDISFGGFDTLRFQQEANREMLDIINAIDISEDLLFLEGKIGLESSKFAASSHKKHLDPCLTDYSLRFVEKTENGEKKLEPAFNANSDFNLANRASDALILQYYEQDDWAIANAANPKLRALSFDDWKRLARIKDVYGIVLFTAPIVAVNVSHAMLGNILNQIKVSGRRFNFLCTHDSTMDALLTALQAKRDPLPNSIEERTPIGFKFVIEKWKDKGKYYVHPYLAYYSVTQLRAGNPSEMQGSPVIVDLEFEGLQQAENGMYYFQDFVNHLNETFNAFGLTARGLNPFTGN